MRRKHSWWTLLLAAALLLGCAGCGGTDTDQRYRVLASIGEKEYGCVFRLGDKAAGQVDAAMKELAAAGELSSLCQKWLGRDLCTLEGESGAVAALAEAPAARTLVVGVDSDFERLSQPNAQGIYEGLSVDMAHAIGRVLGWEIQILPIGAGELETQLKSGNIDCALGFGTERINTDKLTVGAGYLLSEIVIAVPAASEIKRLRQLKGGSLGTVEDASITAAAAEFEDLAKREIAVTPFLSPLRCLSALEQGWCAGVIMDRVMLGE